MMNPYRLKQVVALPTRPGIIPPDGRYDSLIDVLFVGSKDKRGRRRKRKYQMVEVHLATIEVRNGRLYDAGRTLLFRAIPLMQPTPGCHCGTPMEDGLILLAGAIQEHRRGKQAGAGNQLPLAGLE